MKENLRLSYSPCKLNIEARNMATILDEVDFGEVLERFDGMDFDKEKPSDSNGEEEHDENNMRDGTHSHKESKDTENGPAPADKRLTKDDLKFPESTVLRIAKEALPDNAHVAKESRNPISRAAVLFTLFLTDCAAAIATEKKRKTILADDITSALQENGFEAFVMEMKALVAERNRAPPAGEAKQADTSNKSVLAKTSTEIILNDLLHQLEEENGLSENAGDENGEAVSQHTADVDTTRNSQFNEAFNASDDED